MIPARNELSAQRSQNAGWSASVAIDSREQCRHNQALPPFAVKIYSDLVAQIKALETEQGAYLNEVVAALLQKGLAG